MRRTHLYGCALTVAAMALAAGPAARPTATSLDAGLGYYRYPALHGDTIVFTAEGDLWRVGTDGGVAQRLTTHPSEESRAAFAPDGKTLAYSAAYEGPTEVYTLPLEGGTPVRQTYDGGAAFVAGWAPGGEILYATRRYSGLPNTQLVRVHPATGIRSPVPLAQASDGAFGADGRTLVFTRFAFQGSYTKRYQGGTAQNIWRFDGSTEAVPMTADFKGTSKSPMVWNGRIYFLSDRDGHMNVWSMTTAGAEPRQHTRHDGLDAQSPSLSNGRIAYQLGADIRVFDIASGQDRAVPIRLISDFDHLRERWIKTPMEWVASAHLSPTGDRVVLNARGQLFVAPAQQGRVVEATRDTKVRYRVGRFFPDGKNLLTLGDASGEVEFWQVPANGIGDAAQMTTDGKVLRWDGIPSPDGSKIAHYDKDQQLWIYDVASKRQTQVARSDEGGFDDVRWSPDGRWLAYAAPASNQMTRIHLYDVANARSTPVTTDRYDSYSPEFSPDGSLIGPPMPFAVYKHISDDDLASIVAFLRTLPAVENDLPDSTYNIPLPPAYGQEVKPPVKEQPRPPASPAQPSHTSSQRAGVGWHIDERGEPAYDARFLRTFGYYENRAAVVGQPANRAALPGEVADVAPEVVKRRLWRRLRRKLKRPSPAAQPDHDARTPL